MMSRQVFDEVGRFDPKYFMYAEDMDLCSRVKNLGRRNYYLSTATVTHHGGQSTSAQEDGQLSAVVMRESLFEFIRRHRGPAYAWVFRVSTALVAVCRLGVLGIRRLVAASSERRRALSLSIKKWLRIFSWAVGSETARAKPARRAAPQGESNVI